MRFCLLIMSLTCKTVLSSGTKAYKETSEEEKSVVNGHCNHLALTFSVYVKKRQDRLPTMYRSRGQYGVNKLWFKQRSAGKVFFSVLNNLMS